MSKEYNVSSLWEEGLFSSTSGFSDNSFLASSLSVYFVVLHPALFFFIWQVFLWFSREWSVLDFTLGNFFRYSVSFFPLFISFQPIVNNLINSSLSPVLVYVPQTCVDGYSFPFWSLFQCLKLLWRDLLIVSHQVNTLILCCHCLESINFVCNLLAQNWIQCLRWDCSRIAEKKQVKGCLICQHCSAFCHCLRKYDWGQKIFHL